MEDFGVTVSEQHPAVESAGDNKKHALQGNIMCNLINMVSVTLWPC